MKLLTIFVSLSLLWSVNSLAGDTHIILGVDGMACPFCVYGIEKKLKKIDGINDVSTDLLQGKIWVEATTNDVLTEDSARTLLQDAGFTLRSYETHQGTGSESEEHGSGQN